MSKHMCGKGLSWEPLEGHFQTLLPVLFGDRQPQSAYEDEALKEIYRELLTAASRILRSPQMRNYGCDPQDAVHNWFIAIRAAKRGYKPGQPFYKYAFKALSYRCRDLVRRAKVRRTQEIPPYAKSSIKSPSALASQRELQSRLRRALCALKRNGTLSPEQYAAVVAKHYWGKTAKEAGQDCDVCAATINTRAHQARTILREQLSKSTTAKSLSAIFAKALRSHSYE